MARLAEAGGIAATSPRDVAQKAEVLITSLPNVDAFEQVMAGQGGIASSNGTGQIVTECSTLPIEAKETSPSLPRVRSVELSAPGNRAAGAAASPCSGLHEACDPGCWISLVSRLENFGWSRRPPMPALTSPVPVGEIC
jgi:hypothetical protein